MRLLIDVMCGGIVAHLRMCGHDVRFAGDDALEADDALLERARAEDRIVVTRDRDLPATDVDMIALSGRETLEQLIELHEAGVSLSLPETPQVCGHCNGRLESVPATSDSPSYAPDPAIESVWSCPDCGQHFWRGSHWDDVRRTLREVSNQ